MHQPKGQACFRGDVSSNVDLLIATVSSTATATTTTDVGLVDQINQGGSEQC